MIRNNFLQRRPVFKRPLRVEGSLTPCYDCWFFPCHGMQVLHGVGDVFSGDLGVGEESVGDVEVYGSAKGSLERSFPMLERKLM